MEKFADEFKWTHRLECPPNIINDSIKKILCTGLCEFLWDDIANRILPANEVLLIRKNVLLHNLKQNTPDKVIECMRNTLYLKSQEKEINNQICKLEKEFKEQDFVVRKKENNLKSISSKHSLIKAKRDLLQIKYNQTNRDLNDYAAMELICQRLMPGTHKDIDSKKMEEIAAIVASLGSGMDKRIVWDAVLNSFGDVEIPTLWLRLYESLSEDVNNLIKFRTMESVDSRENNNSYDVSVANGCGQHICMVSNQVIYESESAKYEQDALKFINEIEAILTNSADSVNISEWLEPALELQKLETEKISLQNEIDELQKELHENSSFAFELMQLKLEKNNIYAEMETCIQDLQKSLMVLKNAAKSIMKKREQISEKLEKLVQLTVDDDKLTWLKDDLITELDIFHDALDFNALRKIMLKGDIGIYRHLGSCFEEATVSITNSQGAEIMVHFPMIQTPIYALIDCYKHLRTMFVHKKFESLETDENSVTFEEPILSYADRSYTTLELLKLSSTMCDRTKIEIDKFDDLFQAWRKQKVVKAMDIIDTTMDNLTFAEWSKHYNILTYRKQNST